MIKNYDAFCCFLFFYTLKNSYVFLCFFKGLNLIFTNKNTNFGCHAYFIYKRLCVIILINVFLYKLHCGKSIIDFLYVFLFFIPGD